MHSFAVLDISPGLGNKRLICDHAYFLRELGGGGGKEEGLPNSRLLRCLGEQSKGITS